MTLQVVPLREAHLVDFEPMNPPAARFWLKHFCPVCYTLARHVDGGGGYS